MDFSSLNRRSFVTKSMAAVGGLALVSGLTRKAEAGHGYGGGCCGSVSSFSSCSSVSYAACCAPEPTCCAPEPVSCGCGAPAPSYGCGAPAPSCGCGAPAPSYGCGAPVSSCGGGHGASYGPAPYEAGPAPAPAAPAAPDAPAPPMGYNVRPNRYQRVSYRVLRVLER